MDYGAGLDAEVRYPPGRSCDCFFRLIAEISFDCTEEIVACAVLRVCGCVGDG